MFLKTHDIVARLRHELRQARANLEETGDVEYRGQEVAYRRALSLLELEESAPSGVLKIDRKVTIDIPWKVIALLPVCAIILL